MALGHAETLEYLIGFEFFLASSLARQCLGDHICFAKFDATPNGSPEELVDSGVEEGAKVTGAWAQQLVNALKPAKTEEQILSVLDTFEHAGFRLEDFATVAEDKFLRGAMLGGLDSQWERENEQVLAPVTFGLGTAPTTATGGTFQDALGMWNKRKVMPRPAYDALKEGARRKAFTVARMASSELLDTTHAELQRQIKLGLEGGQTEGVNLADFHKFAEQRLQSAGWTPASASHVETIFRTNVISAYSSGRFNEMRQPAVLAALPYWQIQAVKDPRTRESHRLAHGVLLPATDPFWKHAYPPFGYNCRCKVCARTAAWLKRNSATVGPRPSNLPDPGFDSGTHSLIQVPASALKQEAPTEPQAPAPPVPRPPRLGGPESPFPLQAPAHTAPNFRPALETQLPELVTPGLGPRSPFAPYLQPAAPVPPVPAAPAVTAPIPQQPVGLHPPSPFPEKKKPPATREDFSKARITVADSLEKVAKTFEHVLGKPLDPELVHEMLGLESSGVPTSYKVYDEAGTIEIAGTMTHADNTISKISREYTRNADGSVTVHHAFFRLSQTQRATGLGKQVLRNQVAAYDKLNVKAVVTEAAWDGQFVWPNMGFTTRSAEQFKNIQKQFAAYLTETFGLPAESAEKIALKQKTINALARVHLPDVGVTGTLEPGIKEADAYKAGKRFLLNRGNNTDAEMIELQVRRGKPEEAIFRKYLGLAPRS